MRISSNLLNPILVTKYKTVESDQKENKVALTIRGENVTSRNVPYAVRNCANYPLDENGVPLNMHNFIAFKKQQAREEMNQTLSTLFRENGIDISKDEQFTLTVNSKHEVSVSGLEDTEKARVIENVLNENGLGFKLFHHILNSSMKRSTLCTSIEQEKYRTNYNLESYTGYSVDDLVFEQDGIYTKDGKDIISLFDQKLNEDKDLDLATRATLKVSVINSLNKLGKIGMQNIKDISMKIEYKDDSLMDVDTLYGFGKGQTEWLDQMMALNSDPAAAYNFALNNGFISTTAPMPEWGMISFDFRV